MKKPLVFRPQLSEILEARAVPSVAGVALATGLPGIVVTLPPQVSPANPQVQSAFKAFDQSYVQAVDALLTSQEANSLATPANGLATFHASIESSIDALAEELILTLNGSTTGSTTTTTTAATTPTTTTATAATSTVTSQVVAAISSGTSRLESQLLALSIEQLEAELPTAVATSTSSNSTSASNAVTAAEQVHVPSRVPVTDAVGTTTATPSTSSAASPTPAPKAADDVRSAFNTFLGSYFQAVQGTLLTSGSTTTQANRAAFDTQVGQAIQTLETSLTTVLGRYPATSGLGPQIQATLVGTGQTGLKSQLAKLATPQGAQAAVVRDFTLSSTQAIAQALAVITGDVAKLIGPAGN